MKIRQAFRTALLGYYLAADTALAQSTTPVVLSIVAQLDGQSETKRVTPATEASTTEQCIALLERTHTYDVGGSMPCREWETHLITGLSDNTIPQGRDTTTCQFLRHRWAKTGVDVALRPMVVSGEFQMLPIGITLRRFQPLPSAEAPARVDTWTGNVDTPLRVGDTKIMNLDSHDVLTIGRPGKS